MKILYCWRCHRDVPMLDEDEYELLARVHRKCTADVKAYREVHSAPLDKTPRSGLMKAVLDEYRRLTGPSRPIRITFSNIGFLSTVRLARRAGCRCGLPRPKYAHHVATQRDHRRHKGAQPELAADGGE
jgi:hypothetical protein